MPPLLVCNRWREDFDAVLGCQYSQAPRHLTALAFSLVGLSLDMEKNTPYHNALGAESECNDCLC